MYCPISAVIYQIAADLSGLTDGEVTKKFRAKPKIKPPRRKPSVQNKSNRSDYMKEYMEDYRGDGKDYQKKPPMIKQLRKEQKRRLENKLQK